MEPMEATLQAQAPAARGPQARKRLRKAAFFSDGTPSEPGDVIAHVYRDGRRERIAELCDLHPEVISRATLRENAESLRDLEVIFSTWGMPVLGDEEVALLPSLKCLFYAAGATRGFRAPFLRAGVRVVSATAANAVPVAEFCLGQILLAVAGWQRNSREARDPASAHPLSGFRGPGAYGEVVALLGNGAISRKLQELLEPFSLRRIVVDSWPGQRVVSLEEAFEKAFVVSNHFPDVPETRGILGEDLFRRMRPGAVFINTGRGQQVDEAGLVRVLRQRPDVTAVLDVAHPEPPVAGSPLFSLPNVLLSTHISGSKNDELGRMADLVIEEFVRWERTGELLHEVDEEQL
jgi:phosphoglycerate dehydrogenase-like enzyme